ncbi:MAG: Rpn family recombination-promoting nuclease/putative transposase [Muribaculaceae bacterium]|nr:Rpn family recombination-promoting nuclease/putative transposase [Muribaculaceae bacterium]
MIKLLNSIFAGDPLLGNNVTIRFTNTERTNELINGRGLRYDITCTTSTGHHFIVEMQKGEQKHLLERS